MGARFLYALKCYSVFHGRNRPRRRHWHWLSQATLVNAQCTCKPSSPLTRHSWTLIADVTGVLIQAKALCSQVPLYRPRVRWRNYHRISSWNVFIWARWYLNMALAFRYIRIIEMCRRYAVFMNALKRRRPNWLNLHLFSHSVKFSECLPVSMTSSTLADLSLPLIKWWYIIYAGTSCIHICATIVEQDPYLIYLDDTWTPTANCQNIR